MPKFKGNRNSYNKRPCKLHDFKEITDLLFEIAEFDSDPGHRKKNYLNSKIAKWNNFQPKYQHTVATQTENIQDIQDIQSKDQEKHCYCCDQVLTPNHKFDCP